MEVENYSEIAKLLSEKINSGNLLIDNLSDYGAVQGIAKLQKRIKQEINFLSKISTHGAKKEHLLSSNLNRFQALVDHLCLCQDCVAVLQHFSLETDCTVKRLCVDIVAENGCQWIKVVARNPRALSQLSTGAGEFGQRSVLDQAEEYLKCAKQHPFHYKAPQVAFTFSCGIEEGLAASLEEMGIIVLGERLEDSSSTWTEEDTDISSASDEESTYQEGVCLFAENTASDVGSLSVTNRLNLDITTMIAYVSSLTNGNSDFVFRDRPLLSQQASWERKRPVMPVLQSLFQGKQLFCCESAAKDFMKLVNTLGGPEEKARASSLMENVTVVPDQLSAKVQQLKLSGKVKKRSQAIFGTGDFLQAITVTANEGFVRAARNQGIDFAVYIHESRALTEVKEVHAELLLKEEIN